MQQLLLDVFTAPKPSLSNFLVGSNAHLIDSLRQWVEDRAVSPFVYLHGPTGCGKSHLLKAVAGHLGFELRVGSNRFVHKSADSVLMMDDIELLTPFSQVQLFNAFNDSLAGQAPKRILLAGAKAPSELGLREDLRTRIESGLSFRIQPLSDDQKLQALQAVAKARGLELSEEVIEYALRHFQRDMGSLMAVMDSLDRFSLEQHKPVSVHLLRHWMRRREGLVVREQ